MTWTYLHKGPIGQTGLGIHLDPLAQLGGLAQLGPRPTDPFGHGSHLSPLAQLDPGPTYLFLERDRGSFYKSTFTQIYIYRSWRNIETFKCPYLHIPCVVAEYVKYTPNKHIDLWNCMGGRTLPNVFPISSLLNREGYLLVPHGSSVRCSAQALVTRPLSRGRHPKVPLMSNTR